MILTACAGLTEGVSGSGTDAEGSTSNETTGEEIGSSTSTTTVTTAAGSTSGTSSAPSTTATEGSATIDPMETTSTSTTAASESTAAVEESSTSTGPDQSCGPQELLDDDPVLYWRFGDAGTVAIDQTANGQDGAYVGATVGAPGIASDGDTAAELAGNTGSYVTAPGIVAWPSTAFTIELWVDSAADTDGGLVSYAISDEDNEIYIDDPSALDLMVGGSGVETSRNIVDGEWHHVAFTWRSRDGSYQFYIDGRVVESGTLAMGATIDGGGTLVVGQDQDSLGGDFDGQQAYVGSLDELAIYDEVLSAERIQAHREAMLCP